MSKYFGGIFGNTNPVTANVSGQKGVYTLIDQYFSKQEGGWEIGMSASGGTEVTYNSKKIHIFKSTGTFTVNTVGPGSIEYVIIGGGASGGANGTNAYGTGGGGAGQVRTGTSTIASTGDITVTIGAGGATAAAENTQGNDGANSSAAFPGGTITGYGGGGGASNGPPSYSNPGRNGVNYPDPVNGSGSGGGAGRGSHGVTYYGGPTALGANPGGNGGPQAGMYAGVGVGGAGGSGGDGPTSGGNATNPNSEIGYGGLALQLPSTFQSPEMAPTGPGPKQVGAPGPTGNYWIAGGGSGGMYSNPTPSVTNDAKGGAGPGGGGPYGGAGNGGYATSIDGTAASANTGSGGGGGGSKVPQGGDGGAGGSGLILIAYPS